MSWLINYIRQIFCKHDWHIEEKRVNDSDFEGGGVTKVYMRCKNVNIIKNIGNLFKINYD